MGGCSGACSFLGIHATNIYGNVSCKPDPELGAGSTFPRSCHQPQSVLRGDSLWNPKNKSALEDRKKRGQAEEAVPGLEEGPREWKSTGSYWERGEQSSFRLGQRGRQAVGRSQCEAPNQGHGPRSSTGNLIQPHSLVTGPLSGDFWYFCYGRNVQWKATFCPEFMTMLFADCQCRLTDFKVACIRHFIAYWLRPALQTPDHVHALIWMVKVHWLGKVEKENKFQSQVLFQLFLVVVSIK